MEIDDEQLPDDNELKEPSLIIMSIPSSLNVKAKVAH